MNPSSYESKNTSTDQKQWEIYFKNPKTVNKQQKSLLLIYMLEVS